MAHAEGLDLQTVPLTRMANYEIEPFCSAVEDLAIRPTWGVLIESLTS
jgi:hypothetical protein